MTERTTTTEPTTKPAAGPERGPSLPINGFLGGVVAVLLAFLPFSTVIGGGVAGYLQGPDRRAGMKAGALAGLVALVPLLLLAFLVVGFLVIVPVSPGGPGPGPRLFLTVAGIAVVGVLGIYTVGGGALGGYVGSYLKEDRLRESNAG
jgi:hypothetical protein